MNSAAHLQFVNVAEPGFYVEERVVLRPSIRVNVMDYALVPMKGGPTPSNAEDLNSDVYWFPDKVVEAGDFVLLYTKCGTDYTFTEPSGHEVHVFYWGKERAVWKDSASAIAVLRVSDWAFYAVRQAELQKVG